MRKMGLKVRYKVRRPEKRIYLFYISLTGVIITYPYRESNSNTGKVDTIFKRLIR